MEEIARSLQEINICLQMITGILIFVSLMKGFLWGLDAIEENEKKIKKRKKEEKEEIKKEILEYYDKTNKKEK